jgi:hypothetical protein
MKKYALRVGVATLSAAALVVLGGCSGVPRMEFSVRSLRPAQEPTGNRPTPETGMPRLDPEWSPDNRGTSEPRLKSSDPLEA